MPVLLGLKLLLGRHPGSKLGASDMDGQGVGQQRMVGMVIEMCVRGYSGGQF